MAMTSRIRLSGRRIALRRAAAGATIAGLVALGATFALRSDPKIASGPPPGTQTWAERHYGDADAPGFKARNIVAIEFLGRTMFVHKKARRHFLRLKALFEARAPEYAAAVAAGAIDDWSYENRDVRGSSRAKSNHAFGLAVDVNALTNVQGTEGDMPEEVVTQWELEGGEWGGDWTNPDPMHFETHLTPAQIRKRYDAGGAPKDWYLEQLVGY